ncbi:MAG: hypothetical protein P8X42_17270, partial [Calditrichaceae bacterium]
PKCKSEVEIDPALRSRLGIDDSSVKFYKGRGCEECNDSGYSGRTAVIEMLPISDKISELIVKNPTAAQIRRAAVQEGMLSLRQHGLMKLQNGLTTIDEVMRETMI